MLKFRPVPRHPAAVVTENQFAALAAHLERDTLLSELSELKYFATFSKSKTYTEKSVATLCCNGWNTEHLLRLTCENLADDALRCALQWAFAQAYYATFALTSAYFKVAGHTETSHTAILRKTARLMEEGKYPAQISFLALGAAPITFAYVQKGNTSPLSFDRSDKQSVQTQIAQFLSATREIDLRDRKFAWLKGKKDKKRRNLTQAEWKEVSNGLGPTGLLDLLYRKRIKANYQDIDTFLSEGINAAKIMADLCRIVSRVNLVHESFIAKGIGLEAYKTLVESLRNNAGPTCRIKWFEHLL